MPSARPASRLFSEGLLHLVFFLSGFAAILYQLVWQRSLFTIYGTSSESVTIVVTVFMLGLGIGGLLGGALSRGDRWSLPVLFGIAELLIGAFGSGSLQLFRWTALPAADARVGEENRGNLGRRDFLSERRVVDFAAERGEAPARGVRVEAEADMACKGVRVAEDPLQRVGLVDAVRAGHRVQRIHRLGGDADRVGEIALEAELRCDIGDLPAVWDCSSRREICRRRARPACRAPYVWGRRRLSRRPSCCPSRAARAPASRRRPGTATCAAGTCGSRPGDRRRAP